MPCCLIGLGSNLGDRRQTLERAVSALSAHPGIRFVARSSWHETKPAGGPKGQPPFLNGTALVETSLDPSALLAELRRIEAILGRRPGPRWGPRPVDLDLLLFDQVVQNTPDLTLPHPRMAWRRFVLAPAAEVAGAMVHPTTGWTIARLLDHLDDSAPYIAFAGAIAAGKTRLASHVGVMLSTRYVPEPLNLERLEAFYANPSGHAWEIEIEFLHRRAELLSTHSAEWSTGQLAVSDFWFDQSPAFARVWLTPEQWEVYQVDWERLRPKVVRPRLLVLLDAPADRLHDRVVRRGRRGEENLDPKRLEQIRQSILAQATQPDQGPVLALDSDDFDAVAAEVLAAVEAMQ